MQVYYWWIILGIILLIGEVFTLDFSLACFGLALIVTAIPAYLGAPFFWQAIVFCITALVLFFTMRPLALKYLHKTDNLKTNVDALIGKKAVVNEEINSAANTGRVQIDGDYWKAVADEDISVGAEVTVKKMEGNILTVKKI